LARDREREISKNEKIEAMKERHHASASINPGDEVVVEPTRGLPRPGLVIRACRSPQYGPMFDVLVDGKLQRFVAERLSRPKPDRTKRRG